LNQEPNETKTNLIE